jgi:hypothetical protein
MDQPQVQERYPELREQFARKGIELHAISALTRQGTRPLLLQAVRLLQELPAEEMPAEVPVYRPKAAAREFTVTRLGPGGVARLRGGDRAGGGDDLLGA